VGGCALALDGFVRMAELLDDDDASVRQVREDEVALQEI